MKKLYILPVIFALFLSSCSTVRVISDYDTQVNFNQYNTFAFYKPGIDQSKISDLDKKRILRAIEANLETKGMAKSETPSLLVSIFTKEKERVNVYQSNFGWGWGWNPWWYGGMSHYNTTTEGTLYIDLLDAKTHALIWQGKGTAALYNYDNPAKKEERIALIVSEILTKYPPGMKEK